LCGEKKRKGDLPLSFFLEKKGKGVGDNWGAFKDWERWDFKREEFHNFVLAGRKLTTGESICRKESIGWEPRREN